MDLDPLAAAVETAPKNGLPQGLPRARPLGELVLAREDDPDELLKHRFLCRGGGLLVVGPTGVGKSSLGMQMMILWALGREAFGIKPARPLKSLLVQAENDDGDLVEMRDGVMDGLGLNEEERARAGEMVLVVREDQRTGAAFVQTVLRPLLQEHRPDLLWIDPALSYLGGDANSQQAVGGLLRNMVSPLLREFNCGCVVVHHTNKPLNGRERPDWRAGDFAYLGSGSIEWAGWARCVLAVRSVGSDYVFELRAGKRGARLRWKASDGQTTTFTRLIAQSGDPGLIFWRDAKDSEARLTSRGRLAYGKGDLLAHVPGDKAISKEALRSKANQAGIAFNRINGLLGELVADGTLYEWRVKRPRTNALRMIARFPQPDGEVAPEGELKG